MRALAAAALVATGCVVPDPCADLAGTCVALTVQSATVNAVDALHITGTGAVDAVHDSLGHHTALPIAVALRLPSTATGPWHLAVAGQLGGTVVGVGSADVVVTPGQHMAATATLAAPDAPNPPTADLAPAVPPPTDMAMATCDPQGRTAPLCQWRWQDPQPQGDHLVGVVAFADDDIVALSTNGWLLHRNAARWTVLPGHPAPADGNPWTASTLMGAGDELIVAGNVTATGAPLVFHSADRGASWAREALPTATPAVPVGQGAFDGTTAIVALRRQVLARNHGAWTLAVPASGTFSAAAASGGIYLVAGYDNTSLIAASTDHGAGWTLQSMGAQGPPLVGACGAGGHFWAVGDHVIIDTTRALEQTVGTPVNVTLAGCTALDAQHAWAWSSDGTIVATRDGFTWGTPFTVPIVPNAAARSPQRSLTLVGNGGQIQRSSDDGAHFTAEHSGTGVHFSALFGAAPATIFAVGSAGKGDKDGAVARSSDDGAHWQTVATAPNAPLSVVWAASPTDVYAAGPGIILHASDGFTFASYTGAGVATTAVFTDAWGSALGVFLVGRVGSGAAMPAVWRSIDRGATWQSIAINGFTTVAGSASGVFATDTGVWVTGNQGGMPIIYHSTDGVTFGAQLTHAPANATIGQVRGANGELLALLPTDGYLRSDDGVTWTAVNNLTGGTALALAPQGSAIYVLGPSTLSTDRGQTWSPWPVPCDPQAVKSLFTFGTNDLFVAGEHGILHYGN